EAQDVVRDVAVRLYDAFWPPGRTRSVNQPRNIGRRDFNFRIVRRPGTLFLETKNRLIFLGDLSGKIFVRTISDNQTRLRVGQNLFETRGQLGWVQHDDNSSSF